MWNQIYRYQSTRTAQYRGVQLRVVASFDCIDSRCVAHMFARIGEESEVGIGEPLWRDSIDLALADGQILATGLVDGMSARS